MLQTIKAAPSQHVALAAWYPFAFLYHRAIDEQMYFELSGAMLGRGADPDFMHEVRGKVPPPFDRELPAADGKFHAPYTEVPLEYPPAAVPLILLPRLFTNSFSTYAKLFGLEMSLFLVGALALILRALEGLVGNHEAHARDGRKGLVGNHEAHARDGRKGAGESQSDLDSRAKWAALLAIAEGSLAIQRLDAVAAFFLALAFFAAVKRKPWLLGIAGGAAFAVKFVPALILPVLLAADPDSWKKIGDWVRAAAGSVIAIVIGLGPIALAPGAFAAMLSYHSARGLQVETTFATILGAARMITGGALGAGVSFGSENLSDPLSLTLAGWCAPLTLIAIAGVAWIAFRSAPRAGFPSVSKQADSSHPEAARVDRMARALGGAAVLLWIFSKVLSPQYFTWGIPLVLAIPWALNSKTRRPKIATWTFCAALIVTQIYMRAYYEAVAHQEPLGVVTMVLRQGLLIALAVLILAPLAKPGSPKRPVVQRL